MNMDFIEVWQRFDAMGNGPQAELRRCATLDAVAMVPAFYRLFPGIKTHIRHQRLAYFMPYIKHTDQHNSLGAALANKVNEKRLFQVLRSEEPNDLIQLRRLVKQVEPTLNWPTLAKTLFFWDEKNKRRLLEDFFMHQSGKN